MKVLALTILILAIGSLEAGLVKREVATADQLKETLTNFFESIASNTQQWFSSLKPDEIKAQAGQILAETRTKAEPITDEIQKYIAQLVEAAKKLAP
ncbi:apolipoprotein A-II [Leptodactylus fuscus]|uniref:apolipoprotein A-II n=1 Tax=Leptodactylus fuscus TaxID=238119 RepID=UPI003F4F192B